jgi:hypothetical protein
LTSFTFSFVCQNHRNISCTLVKVSLADVHTNKEKLARKNGQLFDKWNLCRKNCSSVWGLRFDESWQARVWERISSTPFPRSNERNSCIRIDESWLDITSQTSENSHQLSSKFEPAQSWWKLMVKR